MSFFREIPTTLSERQFVLARRVAQGVHHPDDLVHLHITGAFRVNAEEEADILELRRHQAQGYDPADEEKWSVIVKERLLRTVRDKVGGAVGVKQEPKTAEEGLASKVKKEVVVANEVGLRQPPFDQAPGPSKRARFTGIPADAEIVDLCSDDDEDDAQREVERGLALAGIAPLNKERKVSRPVIDSDDSECEVLGVATPAVHQAPFNNVKVEPTAPSSQIADGNGRAIRGGDAASLSLMPTTSLSMTKDAIMSRGFDDLQNVKWMNEAEKLEEARRRERIDDAPGGTKHAWRSKIGLLPASFLATVDPKNDWTTLIDLEQNTMFKIGHDYLHKAHLFAKLFSVIQFRAYPYHHTDYTESLLFKAWEQAGAGGEVLLLAAWLRNLFRTTVAKREKKQAAIRAAEVTLVKMQSPMDDADDEADAPGSDPLGESGE